MKRINLVLGEGSSKGFAQIPIINRILEAGVKIDNISGSSIGSIIGSYLSLYREVRTLKEILDSLTKKQFKHFFDYKLSKRGVIKGDRLYNFLKRFIHNKKFQDCKINLFINSFNLTKKRIEYFNKKNFKGKIVDALMASISIPAMFEPFTYKRNLYIDAGFIDPLPIKPLLNMKSKILVISLNNTDFSFKKYNILNILALTNLISIKKLAEMNIESVMHIKNILVLKPHFKIHPMDTFRFYNWKKFYKIGLLYIKKNENRIFRWIDS